MKPENCQLSERIGKEREKQEYRQRHKREVREDIRDDLFGFRVFGEIEEVRCPRELERCDSERHHGRQPVISGVDPDHALIEKVFQEVAVGLAHEYDEHTYVDELIPVRDEPLHHSERNRGLQIAAGYDEPGYQRKNNRCSVRVKNRFEPVVITCY